MSACGSKAACQLCIAAFFPPTAQPTSLFAIPIALTQTISRTQTHLAGYNKQHVKAVLVCVTMKLI